MVLNVTLVGLTQLGSVARNSLTPVNFPKSPLVKILSPNAPEHSPLIIFTLLEEREASEKFLPKRISSNWLWPAELPPSIAIALNELSTAAVDNARSQLTGTAPPIPVGLT